MRAVALALIFSACAHTKPDARSELDAIAERFDALYDPKAEQSARLELEWQQAQALERSGFLNLAFLYATPIAKAGAHPRRAEALAMLVRLQELRRDDFLIPSLFNNFGASGEPLALSEPDAARVAWFRARIASRKGQLQEAISLCAQVPPSSPVFERAEYLRAIALSDLRLHSAAQIDEALSILERLTQQKRDELVRAQATLALARLTYGQKRWAESRRWYEEATKSDSTRGTALVEQGWVLIQLGDWKMATWSVTREEAQLSGRFEAKLIRALAAHYSGDRWEAESALLDLQKDDGSPKIDWNEAPPARALDAVRTERGISVAQLQRVRGNRRLMSLYASITSFEAELERANGVAAWKQNGVGQEFAGFLTTNRDVLMKTAGELTMRELIALQAEQATVRQTGQLLGVEVALARKDLPMAVMRLEFLTQQPQATSEVWFRLAALQLAGAEVLQGADREEARAAAASSIKRVLEGDPSYERLEEARRLLAE